MKGVLGPLVAGILAAMKSGEVKQQLVRFAADRAPITIAENAGALSTQGERCALPHLVAALYTSDVKVGLSSPGRRQ